MRPLALLALVQVLLQGMFPAINIRTARLSACQRVVLLARDKETGLISLRHFTISVAPSGLRKSLKGLLTKREAPDLGKCADVADFVTKSGYASVSLRGSPRWQGTAGRTRGRKEGPVASASLVCVRVCGRRARTRTPSRRA